MQLNHLGRILRRSLWIIILTTLLGGAVAFGVGVTQVPQYSATVRMLFSPTAAASGSVSDLLSANTVLGNRVATYMDLVSAPLILDPVIEELGLAATPAELTEAVVAEIGGTPNIVVVTASSSDAASAAALANSVAQSLATQVTATETAPDAELTGPTLAVTIAEPASAPVLPSYPDIPLWTLIGLAVGFGVGVLIAGIRAYSDTRIRSRQDILAAVGDPDLVVAALTRAATKGFVVSSDPIGAAAETYRRFRSQLRTRPESAGALRIVVTAPRKSKSVAAAAVNLAAVIAEEGVTVCIVDGNLRGAEIAGLADVNPDVGISDILRGHAGLEDALVTTSVGDLHAAAAGTATDAPYSLIASPTMTTLVDDLSARVDVVVIAAPALLDSAESLLIASQADEAVLIVVSGQSRKDDVAEAARLLERGMTPIGGVLLAGVPRRGPDANWR